MTCPKYLACNYKCVHYFRYYLKMNPQFQPPQSFAQNRASPALAQQGNFQNISLGPTKSLPGASATNGPHQQQSNIPSSFPNQSGPFQPPTMVQYGPPGGPPLGVRAPPANRGFPGIPPNQLPPQGPNMNQPSGMPPLSKGHLPPPSSTAGPPNTNAPNFPPGN